MGFIPKMEDWSMNIEYQEKKDKIKKISVKDIKLTDSEIDIAKMQNRSIEEMKKERLQGEKTLQLDKLNKEFGMKEEEKDHEDILPEMNEGVKEQDRQEKLWDLLKGKDITDG